MGIYSYSNPEVQPYAYSGKEVDRLHVLNWPEKRHRIYADHPITWGFTIIPQ